MFDAVVADLTTSSPPEDTRKPSVEDASQRARALLGSLKEKRDFFESRIHVPNNFSVHQKGDLGDFPTVHCPSPTKSSFNFSDMTTTLGSKIKERQNMLNRLTGSPNGSFRTANTQETTASTLSPFTSKETTVIVRIPPAPSLKDIEDSIKEAVCVVIPVRDQSPSPELSTSWLEDSSDTQQNSTQKLDPDTNCYPNAFPASISTKVSHEEVVSPPRVETAPQRYTAFFPSTIPLHEKPGLNIGTEKDIESRIRTAVSSASTTFIQSSKSSGQGQSSTKSVTAESDRTSRGGGVSKKKPDKLPLPGKENVSNRVKSSGAKETKKESQKSPSKSPRPSRRASRSKRTIKDRRKTEMALSAAAVLLEPASSFEDHCDTYSVCSLKSADIPANDYAAAGLRPPVVQERDKIEKLAKHGLKVSPCGSRPTRYVKQCDPRPSKARTRSVSFVLPGEMNIHERKSARSTAVLPVKEVNERSYTNCDAIHFISQNDAEMVPLVENTKEGMSQKRAKEKSPVVLMQCSEDSQEDRSAFLKSVFNTHGPLSALKLKQDIARISVRVNRFGILRKRRSNTSDDSSMDFTSDSNTSGWMSGSGSVDGAVSRAAVEDLSDIDIVIEKRNPRVISSIIPPQTSKRNGVVIEKKNPSLPLGSPQTRKPDDEVNEKRSVREASPLIPPQMSKHIDVSVETRSPQETSPLVSPRPSKQKKVYSAKLVSSPVPAPVTVTVPAPAPVSATASAQVESDENERVQEGLFMPELEDRGHRKNKHRIPILLRPLVFASENQSDALSQCYGGMYSISSESIVEKRIQAFERKIKAGQYAPQYQPISKEFPCATRGSLYDIAIHSGCMMDEEKLTPRLESKRKENPARGGLYYLALSSGLSRNSIESRCSYTIFTKNSACSVIEGNGEIISERDSDERCGASGSLYLARATLSSFQ